MATETTRKIFSNYVNSFKDDRTMSSLARVIVKNPGGNVTVDPVGIALISDNAGGFIPYENLSDISAVTSSTLPDESPICVLVGPAYGAGMNTHDVTLTAAGVECTVLFRDATVKMDNNDWAVLDVDGAAAPGVTPANAGEQDAFVVQLEKQRVKDLAVAEAADPKYV